MKKSIIYLFVTGLILLWFGISNVVAAPVIWVADSSGRLGTVDMNSKTVKVIGTMTQNRRTITMTDIAFDSTGQLWGISFYDLYKINSNTAEITKVGGGWGYNQKYLLNSLAFGDDGTLYAGSSASDRLYSIDTTNGHLNFLGNTGFTSSGDLTFDNGNLYLTAHGSARNHDQLIKIDLSDTSESSSVQTNLGYRNSYGLVAGDDGLIYGLSGTKVFSVDTDNKFKVTKNIFNYKGNTLGKVWGAATQSAVPVPAAVWLLGSGLICLAGLRRSIRQH